MQTDRLSHTCTGTHTAGSQFPKPPRAYRLESYCPIQPQYCLQTARPQHPISTVYMWSEYRHLFRFSHLPSPAPFITPFLALLILPQDKWPWLTLDCVCACAFVCVRACVSVSVTPSLCFHTVLPPCSFPLVCVCGLGERVTNLTSEVFTVNRKVRTKPLSSFIQ